MTTVYFIRHAEADYTLLDDRIRPLTKKGTAAANLLVQQFTAVRIDKIYSSPYLRTVNTITPLAIAKNIQMKLIEDFRERMSNVWYESRDEFMAFSKRQWMDFDYKSDGGEALREVQHRTIKELHKALDESAGQTIILCTHLTALCTMLNHFDPDFNFHFFTRTVDKAPFIAQAEFNNRELLSFKEHPLVEQ